MRAIQASLQLEPHSDQEKQCIVHNMNIKVLWQQMCTLTREPPGNHMQPSQECYHQHMPFAYSGKHSPQEC